MLLQGRPVAHLRRPVGCGLLSCLTRHLSYRKSRRKDRCGLQERRDAATEGRLVLQGLLRPKICPTSNTAVRFIKSLSCSFDNAGEVHLLKHGASTAAQSQCCQRLKCNTSFFNTVDGKGFYGGFSRKNRLWKMPSTRLPERVRDLAPELST
jgi:hypothetical protein